MKRLSDALRPGARVFVPALTGESSLLLAELANDPERARDVHFIGVQFPGIGTADYLALHPTVRQTAFFMSPSVRRGMIENRADLLGLDYPGIVRYLEGMEPVDLAYVQLSPPDAQGHCTAGLCSDFVPIVWQRAKRRVAHINPALPRTRGSFTVHVSELHDTIEAESALLAFAEATASDIEDRIGRHVATLIQDHDTLQFGIGSVPVALASALTGHRRLKLHTGMVSEAVRRLWEAGALDRDSRITTGVALGSPDFYRFVAENQRIWFTDAGRTHDVGAIGAIPRFVAINSAIEVDLFGQVNSERANGSIQAGAGGLPAFAQGALRSRGGRSLICMAATAKRGTVSRIVPALNDQGLCTLPRHLADVVVTEHGIAELRGLSLDARAQALIAIAAPEHRDTLADAWDRMRRKF
ncbi:acetyl-CoA hydrolase/transferase family protein [Aromatoleum diolicum]|uniref:Acetyl-CoA hydrolase n=1 Tax=Aromatoleum diolicum TaxID=75796 RepID=A0ABX1QDS5_9RHOO|nr:acetyl-CoA hydrolase/transferase C-terminal domain-containing protein [Aromatoleum diolicum]NMG76564.1 acetyl-CoA hydrolase [Aromatoleum diolicum]